MVLPYVYSLTEQLFSFGELSTILVQITQIIHCLIIRGMQATMTHRQEAAAVKISYHFMLL